MLRTVVTMSQPGAERLGVDSKLQSAKFVDHVKLTAVEPLRAMLNHGTGVIVMFVIATYQIWPHAQYVLPFQTTPPFVDVENLQSKEYWLAGT